MVNEQTEEVDSPASDDGKTSEQILKEIEEAQERELEIKKEEKISEVEPDQETESIKSKEEVPSEEVGKTVEPAPDSGAKEVTVPPGESDKAVEEWMKKKGFKSKADMARSLRNLERELHRRGKDASDKGALPPQPRYSAPAYPSYSTMDKPPSQVIDELAQRYDLNPDDIKKVGPMVFDIASNVMKDNVQPLIAEISRLNRKIARDTELNRLESDPHFSNPEVKMEMYKVLENNPSIFQNEPAPYEYAFTQALGNIGRRFMEGSGLKGTDSELPSGQKMSTKPPMTAKGTSQGKGKSFGLSATKQIDPKTFASLPLAQKEKILKEVGAIVPEED